MRRDGGGRTILCHTTMVGIHHFPEGASCLNNEIHMHHNPVSVTHAHTHALAHDEQRILPSDGHK